MFNIKAIGATLALSLGAALLLPSTASAEELSGHLINYDDIDWQAASDDVEEAILWGSEENNDAVWVFRMQPGAVFPLHAHSHNYYSLAIQGTRVSIDADGSESPGGQDTFFHMKAGDFHSDRCEGPEVCIAIVDFDGPRDVIFPE